MAYTLQKNTPQVNGCDVVYSTLRDKGEQATKCSTWNLISSQIWKEKSSHIKYFGSNEKIWEGDILGDT